MLHRDERINAQGMWGVHICTRDGQNGVHACTPYRHLGEEENRRGGSLCPPAALRSAPGSQQGRHGDLPTGASHRLRSFTDFGRGHIREPERLGGGVENEEVLILACR